MIIHGELLTIHPQLGYDHTALIPCIQVSLQGSTAHLGSSYLIYFLVEVRNKAATVCEFSSKQFLEKKWAVEREVNEEVVSDEEQC